MGCLGKLLIDFGATRLCSLSFVFMKLLRVTAFVVLWATGAACAQNAAACSCDYTITESGVYDNGQLKVRAGQTVCLLAKHYDYLRFRGFVGEAGRPIRFVNCGGQVRIGVGAYNSGMQFEASRYFVLSGSGDSTSQYGIKLDQSYPGASGLSIGALSSDCEVERVEVAAAGFAGFLIKTDPTTEASTWRENFTMYQVSVHDNYIHDTGGEGLYIGNSFYSGVLVGSTGASTTVYPHLIRGLTVYNNRIERTGAEGIQYGCSPDAQVHHNTIAYAGINPFASNQNNGVQISSGSGGDCFSNTIRQVGGTGITIVGHLGNSRIYNNVIHGVGQDGIFCDDRPGSTPNTFMAFLNNTITRAGRDGIRLYNEINENVLINNVVAQVGGRFVVFQQGATARLEANFLAAQASTAGFVQDTADFRPNACSPLIHAGLDVSAWGVVTDRMGHNRKIPYTAGAYEFMPDSVNTNATQQAQDCLRQRSAQLLVYPSPSNDLVTVMLPDDQFIEQLRVYSQSGRVVTSHQPTDRRLNPLTFSVAQLPAGTYLVEVFTSLSQTVTGRFVKL